VRPIIINYLNELFGVNIFNVIIPTPSQVYIIVFIVVAIILIQKLTHQNKQLTTNILFVFLCAISSLIGAKLAFVIPHFKSYIHAPSHLFQSGSISWGAYVGLFIFIFIYTRIRKLPTFDYLDIIATCIPIGIFIGRWSCYLNGDDFGTLSSLPWAVQYPFNSIPFGTHFELGIVNHTATLSAPVHPNQLYLSLNGLFLFFVMKWIWSKYNEISGLTFASYLVLYGLSRFLIEFFRYYPEEDYFIYLNPSQWISLGCAFWGLLIMRMFHYKVLRKKYLTKA
jgi:phosphatidylglycerol---prolipoprotein diacylglyceryl transferase